MALDGKVTVNDDALARHPALAALNPKASLPIDPLRALDESVLQPTSDLPEVTSTLDPDGQVGILCNGAGLTMATMDLVGQAGGKPANFLNIGSETHYDWLPETLCERLENGLEAIAQSKQVRVVLVNLVTGTVPCDQIADSIAQFFQRQSRKVRSISEAREEVVVSRVSRTPQLVVRLVGSHLMEAKERLSTTQALVVDDLDMAVSKVVSFTKQTKKPI